VALSHIDLLNHFKLNFALTQHHHWNLDTIEALMPWEREIYVTLLEQWIQEENDRIKAQQNG